MNVRSLRLSTPLALCLLAGAIGLPGCGARADSQMVTETGNPPFLERERVELRATSEGVEISGSPGAVPANARVTAKNQTTGSAQSAVADDRGAFEVAVEGTLEDEYAVEVETDDATRTFNLDGADEPGGSGAPACESLEQSLNEQVAALTDGVDRACSEDADCQMAAPELPCFNGCWYSSAVSAAGQAEVEARGALREGTCDEFTELGCDLGPAPSCPGFPESEAVCVAGSCEVRELVALSCEQLTDVAVATRDEFKAELERECAQDSDCVLAEVPLSCIPECYQSTVAINATAASGFEDNVEALRAQVCDPIVSQGCTVVPPPCPQMIQNTAAICNADSNLCEVATIIPLTCDQYSSNVETGLTAALAEAKTGCSVDADCTQTIPATPCLPSCGYPEAVTNAKLEAFEASIEALVSTECEAFSAEQCPIAEVSCAEFNPDLEPVCQQGSCEMGLPELGGSCQELAAQAQDELTAARTAALAASSCTEDTDCAITTNTLSCIVDCTSYVVSTSALEQLNAAQAEIDATICGVYHDAMCASDGLGCTTEEPFPLGFGCVDNECVPFGEAR